MRSERFRRGLRALVTVAFVAYPLVAYSTAGRLRPHWFAVALTWVPLMLIGGVLIWRSRHRLWLGPLAAAGLALLWHERALVAGHVGLAYLAEHAGSLTFLGFMFGSTLRSGQIPLVTRFAATVKPAMSAAVRGYTRGVTAAWTLFFAAMAGASVLIFALRPIGDWMLFASAWTPLLVVLMFVAEYAVRRLVLAPADQSGPYEAIRAYVRYTVAQRQAAAASGATLSGEARPGDIHGRLPR